MNLKKYLQKNIAILIISLILFLAPLIVNYSDLPKGFEIPKVHFLNISTLVLIAVSVILLLKNKIGLSTLKKPIIIIFVITLLLLFTTLLTPYMNISLFGNSFRDQGFIFYILVLFAGFITFLNIKKENQTLIFLSIYLSALIQSIVAISQFINLLNTRPEIIDDGYWINGTYGQANFFSGHIILGIICGVYLITLLWVYRKKKFARISILLIIKTLLILLFSLIISFSIFGWITFILLFFILTFYFLLKKEHFYKLFIFTIILSILTALVLLNFIQDNLRIEIWKNSLDLLFNNFPQNPTRLLFGYGFDTLGNVFKDAGRFAGVIIDRGHNLFIDIIIQTGVLTFAIFSYLIFFVIKNLKKIVFDRSLFFLFLLFFAIIFKTFIHEYSAVLFYTFVVLFGALLGRLQEEEITLHQTQLDQV